jgi:cbb3-type cytochrome oxidase subunit 3
MAYSHEHLHRRLAKRQSDEMENLIKREAAPEPQTTVLSVVYVTADATFTGSVAGYTTLSDSGSAATTQESDPSASGSTPSSEAVNTNGFVTVSGLVGTSSIPVSHSSPSHVSSVAVATSALATSLVTSTSAVSQYSTANPNTAVAAASATASSSSQASSSSGISTGAKIGIAVGVIVLLVAVAGGVLFAYWKKKKQHEEYARQDEKAAITASAAAAANKAPSPAPRLSLRPMSRLMRFSGGNLLNNVNAPNATQTGPGRSLTPSPNMGAATAPRAASPWERRAASPPNANNPFNDPQNPFSDAEKAVSPPPASNSEALAAGAVGTETVGAVAAAGAMAAKKINNEPPQKASPEPMATAGAGSPDAPSNVYRVQLDFKPSMDDELELKASQLVRMLHEYDDGWALCISLDRSRQGVAPRTCLSAKPCKPRPAGAPNGPGPRVMNGPPNGRMSPSMGPPSGRNSSAFGPANGRMSPAMGGGRMSPAMGRPGPPQGRPMSPMTPPGARGPPRMAPQHRQNDSSASINQFNQGPRPLSPGPAPRPSPKPRSQSPGPYGAQGPRSMAPPGQRRRSNSAGGVLMPQGRMSPAPLNPSRLGPGAPSQWPLPANGGRPL